VVFHEANGYVPAPAPFDLEVKAWPRGDLPLRYELWDADANRLVGTADQPVVPGMSVDVVLCGDNRTGEDLEGVFITLSAVDVPKGVEVNVPRQDLERIRAGKSFEGRLSFHVRRNAQVGKAQFEARLHTTDGRAFASLAVDAQVRKAQG
jgi:hypothetical protein